MKSLDKGMTLQQLRVLFLINEGKGQTEMAEILQITTAAISKMMNLLVEKKYVIRQQGADRRCVKVKLTVSGKKVLDSVSGNIEAKIKTQLVHLTKKEITHLEEGLSVLEKLMGMVNETQT